MTFIATHISRYFLLPVFFLVFLLVSAYSQQAKKILFDADNMEFDENIANGAIRLWNNVIFTHEGAKMYCDSAYYYPELNSLDAFNDVYINQGDTLHLYGDVLYYNGNTRIAEIEKNVKLLNKETTLTTDKLDFDMNKSIGYYKNNADILNANSKLSSKQGYYYTRKHMYFFKDSVVVENPDYTIYSDTLKYNTQTSIAYMLGPTEIISDSNYIYCERGWYNQITNISMLKKNARLENSKQKISGDSLYYERNIGYGEAYNNVELFDEEQNVILKGNFATYNEKTENSLLTDSALFIQITESDSIYVHADTLRSEIDTSGSKLLRGYYKVKLFKSNMQAMCDSLSYSFADSIIRLFNKPVIWSEGHQLSSEYIEILTKNKKIDKLFLQQMAFIVSMEDTTRFNQIKGKNMTCYFKNNELYKIDVNGNGQTIYYPKDKNEITGINKAESSNLTIYFKEGKVDSIKFITKPTAILYPPKGLTLEEQRLKNFHWLDTYRPKNKKDIFIWTP